MNEKIKKILKPLHRSLLRVGFEPRHIFAFRYYLKYRTQCKEFQKLGGVITHKYAILNDYFDQAGSASGDYFHQDLLVAQYIYRNNPIFHVDIGSRIDGFVAHVASFRKIYVMDVRELKILGHSNISFIKADLINEQTTHINIADSISCLHAIEHFGLGRYGDRIDPNGHKKGLNNIIKMLKPNGTLYISFPIGKNNEIHFNAHRVFKPNDIFTWIENKERLKLENLDYIDNRGNLHKSINIENVKLNNDFGIGIYTFRKIF